MKWEKCFVDFAETEEKCRMQVWEHKKSIICLRESWPFNHHTHEKYRTPKWEGGTLSHIILASWYVSLGWYGPASYPRIFFHWSYQYLCMMNMNMIPPMKRHPSLNLRKRAGRGRDLGHGLSKCFRHHGSGSIPRVWLLRGEMAVDCRRFFFQHINPKVFWQTWESCMIFWTDFVV